MEGPFKVASFNCYCGQMYHAMVGTLAHLFVSAYASTVKKKFLLTDI